MLSQEGAEGSRVNKSFDFSVAHMIEISCLAALPLSFNFGRVKLLENGQMVHMHNVHRHSIPHTHLLSPQNPLLTHATPPPMIWQHFLRKCIKMIIGCAMIAHQLTHANTRPKMAIVVEFNVGKYFRPPIDNQSNVVVITCL